MQQRLTNDPRPIFRFHTFEFTYAEVQYGINLPVKSAQLPCELMILPSHWHGLNHNASINDLYLIVTECWQQAQQEASPQDFDREP